MDAFEDQSLSKYVDGVAWHGYYGDPDVMTRVHIGPKAAGTSMRPTTPPTGRRGQAPSPASSITGARSIVSWNLVLDEKGKPNIGRFSCGGVVTLNSQTQQITRSGQYWAFAHYAKFLERGARAFATQGAVPDVAHVAAQNPDGNRVLILTNRGQEKGMECRLGEQALALHLPGDSITTLVL
ncbi:MAG: glucosylceramidase [Acidobacteriaceae bacterium]|nr:glucosylceramidase [Acidobacteriaceae bacterium]